jgi:hypothetical protein
MVVVPSLASGLSFNAPWTNIKEGFAFQHEATSVLYEQGSEIVSSVMIRFISKIPTKAKTRNVEEGEVQCPTCHCAIVEK